MGTWSDAPITGNDSESTTVAPPLAIDQKGAGREPVVAEPQVQMGAEPLHGRAAAVASRQHLVAAMSALAGLDAASPLAARDLALRELGRAVREQDAFLHAAAHDLRNPLTALRGHAQLLGRRARDAGADGLDAARVGRSAAAIEEAAAQTAVMIDRLLDVGWLGAEPEEDENPATP